MEVSKEQIAIGIVEFIRGEVIPNVEDTATQVILEVAATSIGANPKLLDKWIDNEMFSTIAKVGNNYNLGTLSMAVTSAIDKHGKITVTIPAIKFVSPKEKLLQFGSDDVKRLVTMIEGDKQ